ncbi:MAG TPA: DinB family protein [Terracidiphilus sp.]
MASKISAAARNASLRQHLVDLITGSNAHVSFDAALKGLPADLRGERPNGSEFSPWQLLEHLRIAQWDILEFSRSARHVSPPWPSGYWPSTAAPPDATAWDRSVRAFRRDRKAFCGLLADPAVDLYARIPHGNGQTILREALLIADHNAYHVGQLILVRRLLGAWS